MLIRIWLLAETRVESIVTPRNRCEIYSFLFAADCIVVEC